VTSEEVPVVVLEEGHQEGACQEELRLGVQYPELRLQEVVAAAVVAVVVAAVVAAVAVVAVAVAVVVAVVAAVVVAVAAVAVVVGGD